MPNDISQVIFSNVFPSMETFIFWLKFDQILFQAMHLILSLH